VLRAAQERIEHRERILEEHRDAAAAHPRDLARGRLQKILAIEDDLPGACLDPRREQPYDRAGAERLAAARLAYDRDRLAAVERQVDTGDEGAPGMPGDDLEAQAADVEQRVGNR
jgi:hypothetical protein